MNESEILSTASSVLKDEANSILSAVERLDSNFAKAVEIIYSHKGKLMISGVGKSGLIGQKIAATLSSTGTPAVFMHSCDAVHGDLGVYEPGDPTLLISNSGATVECMRLIPTLKRFNSKIIALVGKTDSPMALEADVVLDASSGGEADPLGIVPTTSTTLALAMGDALACTLMKVRGFSLKDFAQFHPAGQLGRNLTLNVSDVMHKPDSCARVSIDTTVRNVVIEMTKFALGAASVLNDEGKLIGIITEGDIRRMLQTVVDLDSLTAGDIMTKEPIYVSPETSLGEVARLMESRKRNSKISVLPVLAEDNLFQGIIRIHDIYQSQ